MLPVSDVCLLEDGFGGGLGIVGMIGNEILGFRAKGQVGEEDVALFAQEGAGEAEIDP